MKIEDIRIRDPFIYVEDGTYYLLFAQAGELMLYRSKDLSEFQKFACAADPSVFDSYKDIWAPELYKYNGKYYILVSIFRDDLSRGSVFLVSDGLDKKFEFLTGEYITPAGWQCLDASLFVYQGKPYVCFSNEWINTVTGDGDGALFMAELSPDLKTVVTKPKKIISGKYCGFAAQVDRGPEVTGYVAEGPYLYEEDGNIALLWSTFTDTGYTVAKSVSKTGVFGEYEFERILFRQDGGHCMRFIDLNGTECIALHQPNTSPSERLRVLSMKELA